MLSLTQGNQNELVHSVMAHRSCGLGRLLSENTKMKEGNTMNTELTLAERRQMREFQKTKQFDFCENLLSCLGIMLLDQNKKVSDITIMMLLDALGTEGLSLTIADDASKTFIQLVEKQL